MPDHSYLAYRGEGKYACECGETFQAGEKVPLTQSSPQVTFINDQWEAHKENAHA
jgi:hypothetical protein